MPSTKAASTSFVFWQTCPDDFGVPEPAILIEAYDGTISIESENGAINLNHESLNEFILLLKKAKALKQ